jgi:hypothetical protein
MLLVMLPSINKYCFTILLCYFLQIDAILFAQNITVTYNESTKDFPNPERGFYVPHEVYAGNFIPLDAIVLRNDRINAQSHGSATYKIFSTLCLREYVLDIFRDKPLSAEFLNGVEIDCVAARKAGVKLIIRFCYTNKTHSGDCPDEYKICPPYGDAPKEIVLQHIEQLAPVLQKNADVIAVLQEGFIGIWGEGYFTDYFGDASNNGVKRIMDSSWRDRNDVLKALLNALPKDRMVQVRTPQIKQKFLYGATADVSSKAIGENDAFDYLDKARIGFHNDCFLASPDDYGTFYDYGQSSSLRKPANEVLRKYFMAESRYAPVGGETCDDAFSPQNDCGGAEEEMTVMHYSYLNTTYNNNVNNDWDSGGCIQDIKLKLGYRFVLRNTSFPSQVKAGSDFNLVVNLENVGYASPYNPRPVELVLRNQKTGKEFFLVCKADVRFWFTGKVQWRESIQVSDNIPEGDYALLLNLPDKYASISGMPAYSIRFANENTWEEKTGYNKLNFVLKVKR